MLPSLQRLANTSQIVAMQGPKPNNQKIPEVQLFYLKLTIA